MKKIIYLLLFIFSCVLTSYGQGQPYLPHNNYGDQWQRLIVHRSLIIPFQDTVTQSDTTRAGAIVIHRTSRQLYFWNGFSWNLAGGGSTIDTTSLSNRINTKFNNADTPRFQRKADTLVWDATFSDLNNAIATRIPLSDSVYSGGIISSVPIVGDTINSLSVKDWINQAFYASQVPTTSLTVSLGTTSAALQVEYRALTPTSDTTVLLNWTAGRQLATRNITLVKVMGIAPTFTNPAAGSSTSGSESYTVTKNVNITVRDTVTTSDGKTATASATITWLPRRYWGRSSLSAATSGIVTTAAGGGSELNSSKAKSSFSITASGTNYIYYAYPTSLGSLTSIVVGGFESIGAFTLTVVSITNAFGYTQNYNVYTSNNTFASTVSGIITN